MQKETGINFFEKYLTVWVILCMIGGIAIGKYIPQFPIALGKLEYANISMPIAILIWLIIYPMMLKIDFKSIVDATKNLKGLTITTSINWLIKPFTMYALAVLFLKGIFSGLIPAELADEYVTGAVLLGAAPCTAMVFVWSKLTKGDTAYTLVQVAVNDLILLVAFVPIVGFLLGVSNVTVPYATLLLSVVLFVVTPLIAAWATRKYVVASKGLDYLEDTFVKKFDKSTMIGLLLTLIIIFSFQGDKLLTNPMDIALIAVPLTIQTFLIFFIAYIWAKKWGMPHEIASPGAMIGASNFFELAVAVAIALFGINSGVTLATVVGLLVEVPVMLVLVKISNSTRKSFEVKEVIAERSV
ncbi:ACR3 family arsenite efflux transporter [Ilyobacter sp.]|uniref:ACR3 family arsenite efflux transporter n=1 Tax=Ilyobacter sp. TaxID=3100343 RepID=UPI0035657FB1